MLKSKRFISKQILQTAVLLSSLIWVSACSNTGSAVGKPDGALTLPMSYQDVDKEDTPATLLEKFYFNLGELLDGNFRFKEIRD